MKKNSINFDINRDLRSLFETVKNYDGSDNGILYTASLVFRYFDRYDLEKQLIERALNLNSASTYFLERQQWHSKSWFDRVQPRENVQPKRAPSIIPEESTLERLCIVLAADDNYFELLIECVESLEATETYSKVDIKILDVGLSKPEYFFNRWGIEVSKPGWPVELEKISFFKRYFERPYNLCVLKTLDEGDHYSASIADVQFAQAVLNKPFLHELFPEYEYYLWIDADCWVQDECGLDKLVCLAQRQGHAFPGAFATANSNSDLRTCRVPSYWHQDFIGKPNTTSSLFCCSHEVQKLWAKLYREAGEVCGYWWGQEEEVVSFCMQKKPEIIEFSEVLYQYRQLGLPVVLDGDKVLRNPETLEIIPILGLGLDKKRYFYPAAEFADGRLDSEDLVSSIKAVGLKIDWSNKTPELFSQQASVSLRYRTNPSSYYDELAKLIAKTPRFTVEQKTSIQQSKNRLIENLRINRFELPSERCSVSIPAEQMEFISSSTLSTHEFIALREAQAIVKSREETITDLDLALKHAQEVVGVVESRLDRANNELDYAQNIVRKRDTLISTLQLALTKAQDIVKQRERLIEKLKAGLYNAENIVAELNEKIERLDAGLTEAQEIVQAREDRVSLLDTALKEAQGLAWARETEIIELKKLLSQKVK